MRMRVFAGRIIVAAGLVLLAGCVVHPNGAVSFAPVVVEAGPPPPPPPPPGPVVVAPVYVPEAYVWDGYEYVGWYGNTYVYLAPGGWVVCDRVVLGRFQGWQRYHPDYRRRAVRYDRNHPPVHRERDRREPEQR